MVATSMSDRARRYGVYTVIVLALLATVPWLFVGSDTGPLLGLPVWAAYTLIATVLFACLVAWCLGRFWDLSAEALPPEDLEEERSRDEP